MSTVADFNRIDDCDKTDARCIDAFSEVRLDEDGTLCVETSWGKQCVDMHQMVRDHESCTSLYLSPDENPNCLVYEKEERCGDNDCIHGDDLSRIISLRLLKDTEQAELTDGDCYIYNSETDMFELYPLKTTIQNIQTAIQNINAAISNLQSRMAVVEAKLTPPADAPSDVKVAFTNINILSDYGAVVNDQGVATTLNKNHGVYGHLLAEDWPYDELLG